MNTPQTTASSELAASLARAFRADVWTRLVRHRPGAGWPTLARFTGTCDFLDEERFSESPIGSFFLLTTFWIGLGLMAMAMGGTFEGGHQQQTLVGFSRWPALFQVSFLALLAVGCFTVGMAMVFGAVNDRRVRALPVSQGLKTRLDAALARFPTWGPAVAAWSEDGFLSTRDARVLAMLMAEHDAADARAAAVASLVARGVPRAVAVLRVARVPQGGRFGTFAPGPLFRAA